jgi:hypothetical protein
MNEVPLAPFDDDPDVRRFLGYEVRTPASVAA